MKTVRTSFTAILVSVIVIAFGRFQGRFQDTHNA